MSGSQLNHLICSGE